MANRCAGSWVMRLHSTNAGGMFFWARLTGANGKGSNAPTLPSAIDQGVAFVPGAPFFAHDPDLSTLRLSFATADVAKIEEGIGRLARAL